MVTRLTVCSLYISSSISHPLSLHLPPSLLPPHPPHSLFPCQSVEKATRDLAPAAKRTVMPSVERMLAAYGTAKKSGPPATAIATTTATASAVAAISDGDVASGGDGAVDGAVSGDQIASSSSSLVASASVVSLSAFADYAHTTTPSSPSPTSSTATAVTQGLAATSVTASSPTSAAATVPLTHATATAVTMSAGDPPTATTVGGGAVAASTSSSSSSSAVPSLFKRTSKAKRLADGGFLQWPQPPEDPSDAELAALRAAWEPLMSADLAALVFPNKVGVVTDDG